MANETTLPANGEITGNVLFYSRPEPLSIELHGKLKLLRSETPYAFASMSHVVPLQVTEFGPASLSFPIIFAGAEKNPLAVMSIRPDENIFISRAGKFEDDAYIPAYIRRYPFVLANAPDQEQLIVCIDRGSALLSDDGDVALFEDGKASEYTENAIKFCGDFEGERQKTESFVKVLTELDLLDTRQTNFQAPAGPDGVMPEPVQIADYFAVSEEKLAKLSAEKLVELRDTGALQQIYAHLNSLFGWDRLIAKTLSRPPVAANA